MPIYLINENDDAVYFDNFTVSDTRGRIIEEDHYYAFGLKIAGISSKKLGDVNEGLLENKNLYNDKELFDDADLGWYDYGYRSYDPQIGRFPLLDPLTDEYPELTNYQYASDEPIGNVDMDGLEKLNAVNDFFKVGGKVEEKTLSEVVLKGLSKAQLAAKAASKAVPKVTAKLAINTFLKGVGHGVMLGLNWINHNVNPVYMAFNGINSQFTHHDFLDGTPITHTEGATDAALSLIPGEGALLRPFEKLAVKDATYVVYRGLDKGIVKYIGITSRDPLIRFGEHLSAGGAKSLLTYEAVSDATHLSRTSARVLEQRLINLHGLEKNGGQLLNKINSIAPKNWWQYGIK